MMENRHMKLIVWVCVAAVFLAAIGCVLVFEFIMGNKDETPPENYREIEQFSTYYQITADTMFYQEPSETSNIVKSAKEGTMVTFLGVGEDDFYMVQQEEVYGYIKKQFLKAADRTAEEENSNITEVPGSVNALYEMYVINCDNSISLRARPSMQAESLSQVAKGERVGYISAAQNGFVKVLYKELTGYVLGSYLSYQNQGADVVIKKTMYVVNCKTDISLRSEPSAAAGVMLTIPLHDPVGYIESAGDGFAKISYRGIIGYAALNYLADSFVFEDENPTKTLYVVNCKENITLRNAPAQSAGALIKIPFGEAVGYIGTATNGFYKVQYGGKTGYALSAYLSENRQEKTPVMSTAPVHIEEPVFTETPVFSEAPQFATGTRMIVVECNENISLRVYPDISSEVIDSIPLGAEVEYIESAGNGFFKVKYQGKTGYAKAEYLCPAA